MRMLMGTTVQLDVCRGQHRQDQVDEAYRDAWARLETISWKMNVFDGRSDVAKINHSDLKPVSVGEDTYAVIESAIRFSQETKGAFDITVRPLVDFWRQNEAKNIFPSQEAVDAVLLAIGFQNIQLLAGHQIKILLPNTKIDLGGIAAGYAVDEAAQILRQHGIENFFIDAGGDIYVGGKNCAGEPWRIGIRDPYDPKEFIDVVALENQAVTTSGNYEKYYTIQGQKWSHIIDPVTGYPQKGVISATVIAPTTIEADALATALCVLGEKPGTDYINALSGAYGSLIVSAHGGGAADRFESQEYKNFQYKK
jgi:thiamine biosynthesis lipoprotein